MAEYAFTTRWFIGAPIDRVYAAIGDVQGWPSWWKGLEAVVIRPCAPPGRPATGNAMFDHVTSAVWRTALPYKVRLDARVTKSVPPREIELESSGELVGGGRWELEPEGDGTLVTYLWNVRTTRRWMNVLAPFLRPAFVWNHGMVMRRGGEGLGRLLGARFEDRSHA